MCPAECNYQIYDKELLAIIRCFEEWRPELEGTELPVQVFTNHKALEWFITTKRLTRRQARWAELLSQYNFQIVYRTGKSNSKADALTRRPGDIPSDDTDERQMHQMQTLLPPERFRDGLSSSEIAIALTYRDEESEESEQDLETVFDLIKRSQLKDELCVETKKRLEKGERHSPDISLPHCTIDYQEILRFNDKIVVPESNECRVRLIREAHDQPASGHPGIAKTLAHIQAWYWWKSIYKDLIRYINNCHACRRSKASRTAYQGLLNPLRPESETLWKDITIDFVTGLPDCLGSNAICVVVDRLTKEREFIACVADGEGGTSAEATAKMLRDEVWKRRGLPNSIVSDRGPQFVSEVWKHLCRLLSIQARLSTAFHPETDGQTEIVNGEMERYLRTYVSYLQDDWVDWLAMAQFAANNHTSSSTKASPFELTLGYQPRMSFTPVEETKTPPARHTRDLTQRQAADDFASRMKRIWQMAREEIGLSQARMEHYANANRLPAPNYRVGDRVYLSTKNIKTERPSKKLDDKNLGSFPIKRRVGQASYELELPESMRIHPVFHSSLLRLDPDNPLTGQIPEPSRPVIINDQNEWIVTQILDSRLHYGRLQYRAAWEGHEPDPNWYYADAGEFDNAANEVKRFHETYTHKPTLADMGRAKNKRQEAKKEGAKARRSARVASRVTTTLTNCI